MWNVYSWKNYELKHNPTYSNSKLTLEKLSNYHPLVNFSEIDLLSSVFENLQVNNQFILQIGECAESFLQANNEDINLRLDFMESIALSMKNIFSKEVVIVGRIAGQYAKPRSSDIEVVDNKNYPVYMGDIVNDFRLDETLRQPDSTRLLDAYNCSKFTLNIMNQRKNKIFSSHEALILDYESALTKLHNNKYYNTSAHMLWLGERTRFIGSSHIEYLRCIANPIGVKISSNAKIQDIISLIHTLNPHNIKGKIIMIIRTGVDNIVDFLPQLVDTITQNKLEVLWMIDPMHGNTISYNNIKTRKIESILGEITYFCEILHKKNVYIAGLHLEASYRDITECIGSVDNNVVDIENLHQNYESFCDPRLNYKQSEFVVNKMANIIKHKEVY